MSIFINSNQPDTFKFSGGECHIKLNTSDITSKTEVLAELNTSDDIMCLLLGIDAIRRVNPETMINLTIPYFPYARQDRVCNAGESLSIKVMTDIINALHCAKVTIYDPHSDVTPALLNNCHTVSLADLVLQSSLSQTILNKKLSLVSPDAGAEKKTQLTAKQLSKIGSPVEVFCASKTRDTLTGHITATEIHGNIQGKNLLILDDICDGGRTFIELAKVLKEGQAKDIYLYVTHGIFSKGLDELKEYFQHIYCYHTMIEGSKIDSSILSVLSKTR